MTTATLTPDPTVVLLDIRSVFVAKDRKHRNLSTKDEDDQRFVKSIQDHGILQPIEVRPAASDKYEVVFGIRRFLVAKRLELATIPSQSVERRDRTLQMSDHIAMHENLMRKQLTPIEWGEAYKKLNKSLDEKFGPDPNPKSVSGKKRARSAKRNKEGTLAKDDPAKEIPSPADAATASAGENDAAQEEETEEFPRSHTHLAAEITGESIRNVQRKSRIADAFTEEQMDSLDLCNPTEAQLDKLAAVKPEEARAVAVGYFTSGDPVDQAIAAAKAEHEAKNAPSTNGLPKAKTEHEMTDDEWLMAWCKDIRSRIQDTRIFDADAIFGGAGNKEVIVCRARCKDELARVGKFKPNPYYAGSLYRALYVEHPRSWYVCFTCQGANADHQDCKTCEGRGYKTTLMEKKK